MITIDDKFLQKSPLAEGGEGIIYEYNNQIIKIYKSSVNINDKLSKIKALMSKNLPSNVVKPLDLVYSQRNQFVGYLMDKVDGEEFKRLSSKKFTQINNIDTKTILKMLIDIKDILTKLHKENIYISDLNDCNILFDKNYNVYFIDCDSWTIDNYKCTVCMDSFKDPLMNSNNFSDKTDNYAMGVLTFKSLTRLHPFGGTTNPDIDIIERMKKGISVIDNKSVTIPKTIKKWSYISPKLITELKDIFENKNRNLIINLEDFYSNLKYCDIHKEYYYSKFNECPLCNDNAKLNVIPVQVISSGGIPIMTFFTDNSINTILSEDSYLDINGNICHIKSKIKCKYKKGYKYYFSDNGDIIYIVNNKTIQVNYNNKTYTFDKTNKSEVVVRNNKIYYINLSNNLIELTIDVNGNYTKTIEKVSFNNIFEVIDDKNYFICNSYDGMKIINVSGYNFTLYNNEKITNYGLHYDVITRKWLFIIENQKGDFKTYVLDKNRVIYQSFIIKYSSGLDGMCFYNDMIFKPCDKVIKAFSYGKNLYKDFNCDIVNEDSKLIKIGNKFTVINEKEIYRVG